MFLTGFAVTRARKVKHCSVQDRKLRGLVSSGFLGCIFQRVVGVKLFSVCGSAAISYWLPVRSLTPLKVYIFLPLSKGSRYIGCIIFIL